MDWRKQTVAWLKGKAAEQAQNNERWPRHAACYPSRGQRVEFAQRLADELEAEIAKEPHPLEFLHMNKVSYDALADAYEAEYRSARQVPRSCTLAPLLKSI